MSIVKGATVVALLLGQVAWPAVAQTTTMERTTQSPLGEVRIGNTSALQLPPAGNFTGEQRAALVQQALINAIQGAGTTAIASWNPKKDIGVGSKNGLPIVTYRNKPIVSVTGADTKYYKTNGSALANQYADKLRGALNGLKVTPNTDIASVVSQIQVAGAGTGTTTTETAEAGTTPTVAAIRKAFAEDPMLKNEDLDRTIRVREEAKGRVTITGTVRNRRIEEHLIDKVERMPGVEAVVNEIEVHEPAAPR